MVLYVRLKVKHVYTYTLFGETFARELSRFLAFFAKVYLAKVFKMAIRESLSSEIFLKHQFAKVYPVKFVKKVFYFFLFYLRHKRVN